MKEVDYRDFSHRLYRGVISGNKRVPVNATLELTYRCNNRCLHCYCNLPAGDEEARTSELACEEIENVLDELKELGCLWLLLTGGEPMLRKDFSEIYRAARRRGFIVTVFTNGTLIDNEIVELFQEYPPFYVEITMYGATRETYEKITRAPGSYERYMAGIERLLQGRIKLRLKAVVVSVNLHELTKMDEVARGFGCHFRIDPLIHGRIDNNTFSDPFAQRISPDDAASLDVLYSERMRSFHELCERHRETGDAGNTILNCGGGVSSLEVLPYGIVTPCAMLTESGLSVREHSVRQIWTSLFPDIINRRKVKKLKCDDCDVMSFCSNCAGWSFVEHGDYERDVEYLCDIARSRAKKFPFTPSL